MTAAAPEYVVVHRDALFELLGRVALPGPGRQGFLDRPVDHIHDGDVDCAVLAGKLTRWVDEHDLADVYLVGVL